MSLMVALLFMIPHSVANCIPNVQADLLKQVQATSTTDKQISNGQVRTSAPKPDVGKRLAAGLRNLADLVEQQPELVSRAADLMSMDFTNSRAPPAKVCSHVSGQQSCAEQAPEPATS